MSVTKKFMTWLFGKAIEDVMNEKIKDELERMLEDKVTKPITKRMDETNAFVIMAAKSSSSLSGNKIQEAKDYAKILEESDPNKSVFNKLVDLGIRDKSQENS